MPQFATRSYNDFLPPVMPSDSIPSSPLRHLARLTFLSFLLTFIASRSLVILIMSRKLPDLFLHLGGTHVHHLNYEIFYSH